MEKAYEKAAEAAQDARMEIDPDVVFTGSIMSKTLPMEVDGDPVATPRAVSGRSGGTPMDGTTQRKSYNHRKHVTYYNLRLKVPASRKAVDKAVKQATLLLKILQDSNKSVIVTW
mmetsp:Transcript_58586/g.174422  ORF Transcript_58586/g.174422 Transcript_58586/m.174422 type:complete len:115 (-) Transcript_58586:1320-1664(-)